jgi:TP901 family phage tail tape measure protein
MSDINNTFGLDASQAIRELGRLDRSIDAVNASMSQFQVSTAGVVSTPFDQITQSAGRAGRAGANALTTISRQSRQAGNEIRTMGLSFQDVTRIVQSQILFAAISEIRQGFGEAAEAAAEFQLQLQRINAIAEGSTVDRLDKDVKDLARTLGRDLTEVSEAAFEALQNDIGNTEETFEILRGSAQDLALITGGTLPQAVNALSSVIKSYGLNLEEAQKLSGIFFGAINAGRITLAEFENSLGTVTPLAREVGVEFEQVATAIATITRSGTQANVATTQLRNVFNKLIKPTDLLKKRYQELGIEGFDELTAKGLSLAEGLQVITEGLGEQEIARLFNTIRANLGVLNILTGEGKEFADVQKEIAKNSLELADSIEAINQTDARQAQLNAAELNVIFTELGDSALTLKNAATDAFLSVVEDTQDAKSALLALGTTATAVAVSVRALGLAFSTAIPLFAAASAGIVAGLAISDELDELKEKLKEVQDEASRIRIDGFQTVRETVEKLNKEELEDLQASFSDVNSELNKAFRSATEFTDGLVDGFRDADRVIDALQNSIIGSFTEGRTRLIDQLGDSIKSLDDQIAEDAAKLRQVADEADAFRFERSLEGLNDFQQAQERVKRAQDLITEAVTASAQAGLSEESRKAAEAANRAAEAAARQALSQADRTGNVRLIQEAETAVLNALGAQSVLLKEQQDIRSNQTIASLEEQRQAINKINVEQQLGLKEVQKIQDQINDAVASGEPQFKIDSLTDQFNKARAELLAGLDEVSQSDIVRIFGLQNAAEALEAELQAGLDQADVRWDNAISALKNNLANTDFELDAVVNTIINEDELALGVRRALATGAAGGGLAQVTTENAVDNLRQFITEQTQLQQSIEETEARLRESLSRSAAQLVEAGRFNLLNVKINAPEIVDNIGTPVVEAIKGIGTASAQELTVLRQQLFEAQRELADTSQGIFGEIGEVRASKLNEAIDEAISAVNTKLEQFNAEAQFAPQALQDAVETLQRLEAAAAEAAREASRTGDATDRIAPSANNAKNAVSSLSSTTDALAGRAAAAAVAFNRLEQAALSAAAAASSVNSPENVAFRSTGGQVNYRANGGDVRGSDTIPTALSAGEFVVNKKSTASFLPELQAINAGNFTGDGSTGDTNISIGDINVSSTSQLPSQTAREVGNSIKRELRRGTFRL